MTIRNTANEFGGVTKLFHWVTAILIAAMFPLGYLASDLAQAIRDGSQTAPAEIDRAVFLFSLHKTFGVAIFLVAMARIAWAISQPRPGLLNADNRLEALAAEAVHWSLYIAILAVPAAGWIEHAASSGFAPIWWPLGQSLPLVPKSDDLAALAGDLHVLFQYVLLASVSLHVLGALKHHFVDRDMTLRRMLPGRADMPVTGNHSVQILSVVVALAVWGGVAGYGLVGQDGRADSGTDPRPLASEATDWIVTDGELALEILQLGNPVVGRFPVWNAAIAFEEPDVPGPAGTVEVGISIESLELGSVTDQAKGEDFFDAGKFPTARFKADLFRTASGYEARGSLAVKEREIAVVLPFELDLDGGTARMSGSLTLDRLAFGIGNGITDQGTLAFEVRVKIRLVAVNQRQAET